MNHTTPTDYLSDFERLGICVVIPTYNNAATLRDVVEGAARYCRHLIVVNDGSTDATRDILATLDASVTVVDFPANRGKGAALRAGFRKAASMGFEYAVTIDSDGQHYPSDLPMFAEAIARNPGALIVGERDLSGVDINAKSAFANKFSNFWFRLQTGCRLRDTQTGYRAYPLSKLHGLRLLTSRYEAELELLVLAAWHGVEIVGIPINVYYPPQEERVTHFRPIADFARISVLNTILCAGAVAYGLPARIITSLTQKRLFNREFKIFTRRNGDKREAAVTLDRLARSIYGLSYFLFWSVCVFTPGIHLYFSIGQDSERKRRRLHRMLQWISNFLTVRFPGATTEYENPSAETFDRPALIICNHQSHLDLPVLMSISPKMIFLTNDWVWNNPFYGRIIHQAEFLPVSAGMDVILPRLRDLRDRGYSIVVFPEGTRSADCSILRFRQGAFMLARELELDIVPMVLHGAGHYLPKKDFMFRKGRITLKILPRISTATMDDLPTRKWASVFRRMISDEYTAIATRRENVEYFRSLVLYKYAWRGWRTVARCKSTLKQAMAHPGAFAAPKESAKIRIVNSGIGTFALLYALVNPRCEVFAFESCRADHLTASGTPALPPNLHFKNAIWESDYGDDADFDLTIALDSDNRRGRDSESLKLNIKS